MWMCIPVQDGYNPPFDLGDAKGIPSSAVLREGLERTSPKQTPSWEQLRDPQEFHFSSGCFQLLADDYTELYFPIHWGLSSSLWENPSNQAVFCGLLTWKLTNPQELPELLGKPLGKATSMWNFTRSITVFQDDIWNLPGEISRYHKSGRPVFITFF